MLKTHKRNEMKLQTARFKCHYVQSASDTYGSPEGKQTLACLLASRSKDFRKTVVEYACSFRASIDTDSLLSDQMVTWPLIAALVRACAHRESELGDVRYPSEYRISAPTVLLGNTFSYFIRTASKTSGCIELAPRSTHPKYDGATVAYTSLFTLHHSHINYITFRYTHAR